MGGGIWSMHFIGMLAFRMHMSMKYDIRVTLLSMVVAIIFAFFVLEIVKKESLTIKNLILASILLGIGICAMHLQAWRP